MRLKRWDIILIAALLLLAGGLWLLLRPGGQGAWAVVTIDGVEAGRYSLGEDVTVRVGEEAYNILTIRDGAAAITEANCGDRTCVRTGAISRQGETIVCLPHKLVVEITENGDSPFDSVAR